MYRYFKRVINSDYISERKSKGLPDESIRSLSAPNNFLNPSLNCLVVKTRERFNGSCLKQDKITYTHGKIANIYVVYEVHKSNNASNDPTLENCFLGAVILTENADIDKYKYSEYGTGFDRHGFLFRHGNTIIFGVDMSSSRKIYNRK